MNPKKPVALVILDGFGYSEQITHNAIAQARTPNFDMWFANNPHAILQASGTAVGLLDGMIGNSEVGHLAIGAGKIIKQPVTIIHEAIDNKTFFENKKLTEHLKKCSNQNSTLHIMGLLSDAGVHSHMKHLFAYLDAAMQHGIKKIVVHPFLDGRDVPPQSAKKYLEQLEQKLKELGCGTIGSLHGRFYAMDRDNNFERTLTSYHTLTQAQTKESQDWRTVLANEYAENTTDEFITPTQLDPNAIIKDGDTVIFINFRPDRARQLTSCFVDKDVPSSERKPVDIECFITPVEYSPNLQTTALFERTPVHNTLKETLSKNGNTIFSIAETEKYAHVTYFFSGEHEEALPGEERVLIPSIVANNYVDNPQMSAREITEAVIHSLKNDPRDFYLINYANADMVAHSGDLPATIKAIECLDAELKKLHDVLVTELGGTLIITADHGSAENMYDKKADQPRTAHTINPVPFIVINGTTTLEHMKGLADIKDVILKHF